MNSSSSKRLVVRATSAALLVAALCTAAPAGAQESVRPEIGKPLQAAQEMIKAQRFKEALGKVR